MALAGCEEVIDLDPVDRRAPVEPQVRPKPISGGTLAITSDNLAVAADPDRDIVSVVDLEERRVLHTVRLAAGDEPGRVVEGGGGRVHVVLRGFGGIATIDPVDGTVLARRTLCPDPRGLAYDDAMGRLVAACADGTVFELLEATGAEIGRTMLEPDLRDVMIVDGAIEVSQFRAAQVIGVGNRRTVPIADFEPHVAWRTWADSDGDITMLHQLASVRPVPIDPEPAEDLTSNELPYGGSGGFCRPGISTTALTTLTRDGEISTTLIPQARLAVDAAVSPVSGWVALAMPGAPEGSATLGLLPDRGEGCVLLDDERTEEQIVAVAFDANDTLVAQSREPARLLLHGELPHGTVTVIELTDDSRYDTGHEIFHRVTDAGLSCATCHPEGSDDGHVWDFVGLGPRRTQALDIGIGDTAPFHWDGDMGDIGVLMEEVLAHRMGGMRQTAARRDSFTRWVFAQQRPPADAGLDEPALVQAGQARFEALDCGRCHDGPELGGRLTTPVRGMELQVPSLRRVSLRPPYMHDGRSYSIEAAVRDMIVSTTTVDLVEDDVQAISAYMRTL